MTLQKPNSTSTDQATAFNRHNVKMFFENLQVLHDHFEIFHLNNLSQDKTGVSTVPNSN